MQKYNVLTFKESNITAGNFSSIKLRSFENRFRIWPENKKEQSMKKKKNAGLVKSCLLLETSSKGSSKTSLHLLLSTLTSKFLFINNIFNL